MMCAEFAMLAGFIQNSQVKSQDPIAKEEDGEIERKSPEPSNDKPPAPNLAAHAVICAFQVVSTSFLRARSMIPAFSNFVKSEVPETAFSGDEGTVKFDAYAAVPFRSLTLEMKPPLKT